MMSYQIRSVRSPQDIIVVRDLIREYVHWPDIDIAIAGIRSPRLLNDLVATALRPAYWSITLNFLLSNSQNLVMPRRGSKPGKRRGDRQKGSLNKLSIGRMKAQLAASAPEFDPYDQLEIIAKSFLERAHAEQHRDKPNIRLVDDCSTRRLASGGTCCLTSGLGSPP